MLRFLRKYSSSIGVKILYGVLAALFVIWGVGAIGGDTADVVARVQDQVITRRDLDRATAAFQKRLQQNFGGRLPPEFLKNADLRSNALEELIDDALIRHEAERLGIAVTDSELLETMRQVPDLQDAGRRRALLTDPRIASAYEEELRRILERRRVEGLVVDGVAVSDGEIADRYRLDHDKVDLVFVRFAAADLARDVTLSDQDLTAYLEANAERYREPARVRVRYAAFRPGDLPAETPPTDGQIAEYYELNKEDRFTAPEEMHARHILVKVAPGADDATRTAARRKAEDLLQQIKGGADFAALAKAHSEDPGSAARGGDLGFFPHGRMVPAFESAVLALEPGAVSDVVETPFGFHVIRLEERRAAHVKSLDEVRAQIVDTLAREQSLDRARKRAEEVRRAIVGGTPFAEAVGSQQIVETPPFAAEEPVPGVGSVKDFSELAFALGENQVSDLIETESAIYLLTPFEHIAPHTPPLDQVRTRVEADVRRERGEAAAGERAAKLLARAREIGLERAAAEVGAPLDSTGPFDRRGTVPKIGAVRELRTDALALTPESPVSQKVYTASGDAVVVALRESVPADMAGLDAAKDQIRQTLLTEKRTTALSAFMNLLKQRAHSEGKLELVTAPADRG